MSPKTAPMTTHERFSRMFDHREADRVPIVDYPWPATIERWQQQGMPADVDFVDFFDIDRFAFIDADTSPRYEIKVLEETDEYRTETSPWGVTIRNWKHEASTPEFLDFTIVDPETWRQARERIEPTRDRINWDHLKKNYPIWRKRNAWVMASLFFGFDVTHSWVVGTERVLMALKMDPEWCVEMFNFELDTSLALLDTIWNAGYEFDSIFWCDDMGFKNSQFFSVDTYRELLKPVHQRAVDWAHAKGIKAHLHSCGDINPLIPELIDIGVDALNPLEVKAGMDPVAIKGRYGDDLVLHGGINAVLWDDTERIVAEMERVVPVLKEGGGYIFSSDHSVPSNVTLENFRAITDAAKRLGAY